MDALCLSAAPLVLLSILVAGAQGSDTSKSQFISPLCTGAEDEFVEGAGGAGVHEGAWSQSSLF